MESAHYKYFTNLVFSVHTVSYGSLIFPFWFMAHTGKVLIGHKSKGEKTWSTIYNKDLELIITHLHLELFAKIVFFWHFGGFEAGSWPN